MSNVRLPSGWLVSELPVALLGAGLSRGVGGEYVAAGFETPVRSYFGGNRSAPSSRITSPFR
jgi:hypothetical protein